MGIKEVKTFYVSSEPNQWAKNYASSRDLDLDELDLVYMVDADSDEFKADLKEGDVLENSKTLKEYVMDNFTAEERKAIKEPKFFYQVTIEKPGGLVMPVIIQYNYADGSSETKTWPAQVWRYNDMEITKAIASEKEIVSFVLDPNEETADIDTSNNAWPKKMEQSEFDKFKNQVND